MACQSSTKLSSKSRLNKFKLPNELVDLYADSAKEKEAYCAYMFKQSLFNKKDSILSNACTMMKS